MAVAAFGREAGPGVALARPAAVDGAAQVVGDRKQGSRQSSPPHSCHAPAGPLNYCVLLCCRSGRRLGRHLSRDLGRPDAAVLDPAADHHRD